MARLYFCSFLSLGCMTICINLTMFAVKYFNRRSHFIYGRPERWGKTLLDFVLPPVGVSQILRGIVTGLLAQLCFVCALCLFDTSLPLPSTSRWLLTPLSKVSTFEMGTAYTRAVSQCEGSMLLRMPSYRTPTSTVPMLQTLGISHP